MSANFLDDLLRSDDILGVIVPAVCNTSVMEFTGVFKSISVVRVDVAVAILHAIPNVRFDDFTILVPESVEAVVGKVLLILTDFKNLDAFAAPVFAINTNTVGDDILGEVCLEIVTLRTSHGAEIKDEPFAVSSLTLAVAIAAMSFIFLMFFIVDSLS